MAMPEYESWDDQPEEAPEKGVADITEAQKYEFLQLTRQGYDRREAALALGYKARPWRALTSPASMFYDEEFTTSYMEAKNSLEAQMHFTEQVREEVKRRALTDSDRLLEKLAMVHLPEWSVLRQKDVNVNVRAVIEQAAKELPTELLKRVLDALESGETIEDAEIFELPPAVQDALPPSGNSDEPSEKDDDGDDDPA
jgi:hypothetical protein